MKRSKNGAQQNLGEKDERGWRWTACSWVAISPFSSVPRSAVLCSSALLGSGLLLLSPCKGFTLRFACNYGVHIAAFTPLMCEYIFYVMGFKGF